jgi:hypothetical protein
MALVSPDFNDLYVIPLRTFAERASANIKDNGLIKGKRGYQYM